MPTAPSCPALCSLPQAATSTTAVNMKTLRAVTIARFHGLPPLTHTSEV